jgi:hypothetical protein
MFESFTVVQDDEVWSRPDACHLLHLNNSILGGIWRLHLPKNWLAKNGKIAKFKNQSR